MEYSLCTQNIYCWCDYKNVQAKFLMVSKKKAGKVVLHFINKMTIHNLKQMFLNSITYILISYIFSYHTAAVFSHQDTTNAVIST